jgi:predicted dehydrogenase
MLEKKRTVGLIGCGKWGRLVLRDLLSLGVDVYVVAPSEATRHYALQQGAKAAYEDIGDADAADGYVIVAPTSLHARLVERLLPAGKPIFVEKPLCINPDDARRIAERGRDRVFVMDKWRYHPGVQKIAQLAQNGVLGKILSIRITRMGWGITHDDVGAVLMLLPHDLSILLHVLGNIPPVRSVLKTAVSPTAGGLIALLGGGADPLITLEISIITPEHRRSFVFTGENATVQLADSYETKVLMRRGPPGSLPSAVESIDADGPMPLLEELRMFVEHLQGGPSPMSSAEEGALIVERLAEIRRLHGLSE